MLNFFGYLLRMRCCKQ